MKEGQGLFNLQEDTVIRSALDMVREQRLPAEIEGQKVLARGQAAYDAGSISRSSWKMGFLYLTGAGLMFAQGGNTLLNVPLDSLSGLQVVGRNWVPGKLVQQLRLVKKLDGQKSTFYFSVKEPGEWVKTIKKAKKETL